jgi:transposase InsO family protein
MGSLVKFNLAVDAATAERHPEAESALVARGETGVASRVDFDAAEAKWAPLARQRAEFVLLIDGIKRRAGVGDRAAWVMAQPRLNGFSELPRTVSYNTYRNWREALAGNDVALDGANWRRLVPGYRACGRPALASAEHPFIRLVARHYCRQDGPDLPECVRMATLEARARKMDHPECMLTLAQVSYYFKRPEVAQGVMLSRMGEERYRNEVADYIDRDWSNVPPGYCLVGDHHVFDCAVRTWDEAAGKWRPVRPWLTAWMCNRSLYFAGWLIRDISPDSLAIEDALLMAIRTMGNRPPKYLYTDNGKDYLSLGLTEDLVCHGEDGREFRHSIRRQLGCESLTAIAYNARAKLIERMFREVAGKFAKYWFGYLGNRAGSRPENGDFAWDNPELLPTLGEFCEAFAWWLQEIYHNRPAEGSKITGGLAPAALFATFDGNGRVPLTDQELAAAMRKPVASKGARDPLAMVRRGGRLHVGGHQYQAAELWPLIGRRVMLKSPRTAGDDAVYAYRPDGTEICRAAAVRPVPAIAESAADRQRISDAMAATRRQLVHARTQLAQVLPTKDEKSIEVGPVMDRLALAGSGMAEARRLAAVAEGQTVEVAQDAPVRDVGLADDVRELDRLIHERETAVIPGQQTVGHDHDDVALLASLVRSDRRMD